MSKSSPMREEKKTEQKQTLPQSVMLNSSSSSTIHRQRPAPETHRSANVGCMYGICFHLFSNHHATRPKFLTFRKKERGSSAKTEKQQPIGTCIAIESPRSPTVRQEIRCRSSSVAAEKRMLLLGDLAKCDEDLRELKKFIDELKSDCLAVDRDGGVDVETMPRMAKELGTELSSGEQPSPVSVLDELTRSPPRASRTKRSLPYGNTRQQQLETRHEEEFLGSPHLRRIQIMAAAHHGNSLSSSPLWCSRAMVATVEKACNEIAWGENREMGRIGMALQAQIYRDLVEETVKEVIQVGKTCGSWNLKLFYTNTKTAYSKF
uniref:Uncharacterized protein n=1 Tax=Kalanchoe fedtschenkoi TaxID=63787 RepID=A0A7N0SZ02_KALFE